MTDTPTPELDAEEEGFPTEHPVDPAFILLILIALTILGLRPVAVDARYTLVWVALIGVGVLALIVDQLEVEIPTLGDMALGGLIGGLLGIPMLLLFNQGLAQTSRSLLGAVSEPFAFQSLVLVMPAAETLFFRGALQVTRGAAFTVIGATVWAVVLFFPQLRVLEFPLVAAVILAFFLALNAVYSYVKIRFGLFAAWVAQMILSGLLLFVPRLIA